MFGTRSLPNSRRDKQCRRDDLLCLREILASTNQHFSGSHLHLSRLRGVEQDWKLGNVSPAPSFSLALSGRIE